MTDEQRRKADDELKQAVVALKEVGWRLTRASFPFTDAPRESSNEPINAYRAGQLDELSIAAERFTSRVRAVRRDLRAGR